MKKNVITLFSLLFAVCMAPLAVNAQSYDKLWKEVEQANEKSRPQTAIQLTEKIYRKAKSEKNSPQMLKAYTYRSQQQRQLTPDSFYVELKGLEEWVKQTNNPVDCAILHTLIADTYSTYASNNAWQLRRRTNVEGVPPADIREWTSNLFIEKILSHTQSAMEDSVVLLNTSTRKYAPFIDRQETSTYYHHDMYHVLAAYNLGALQRMQYSDQDSAVYRAIGTLHQSITNVYKEQNNVEAFLLSTLNQLNWEQRRKDDTYLARLDELIAQYASNPVCVEVYLAKAQYLSNAKKKVEALDLCYETISNYPKYVRINAVKELKESILHPELSVATPKITYPQSDLLLNISHRNLDRFSVVFLKVNLPGNSPAIMGDINDEFLKKYTHKASEQTVEVERPEDYIRQDTVISITAPEVGLYLMQVYPEGDEKNMKQSFLSVTRLKVINLALPNGELEMIALDNQSGKPLEGVNIHLLKEAKGEKKEIVSLTTGADGKAKLAANTEFNYIYAEKGTDNALMPQRTWAMNNRNNEATEKPFERVTLLTDRAVYRPGQTVYLKGVAYKQNGENAQVLSNKKYTVTFTDANSREVGKQEVRTNEFGSFTATFVVPTGGLNGHYVLLTDNGVTNIMVEEYKRPTFDITFNKPEGSYRLGDSIQVSGNAKTFSGIAMQGLPVTYKVTRDKGFPWMGSRFGYSSTQLHSGTVTLNEQGEFNIPVYLQTEAEKSNEGFNYYIYIVEATVTNEAGETQTSTHRIFVGDRSLVLSCTLNPHHYNKDDSIKTTFNATNLSGSAVTVQGTYSIYPIIDKKSYKPADKAVLTGEFTSGVETILHGCESLPSGPYKIKYSAKDEWQREVTGEVDLSLFSVSKDTRLSMESLLWHYPLQSEFDADQTGSFLLGTSYKDAYVLMDMFSGEKRIESRLIQMSDTLMRFDYPYRAEYGDGITINFFVLKNDNFTQQTVMIKRKVLPKKLELSWEVFRDKLRPGQEEQWKLTIKDAQGAAANAELLATMYDASLDKIRKHDQRLELFYNKYVYRPGWSNFFYPRNIYFNFWFKKAQIKVPALLYDHFWMNTNLKEDQILYMVSDEAYATGSLAQNDQIMIRGMSKKSMVAEEALDEVVAMGAEAIEEAPEEIRTNFAETAFFYPQLQTNEQGEIVLSFTMPESLTCWNFRGYAHTKEMITGSLNGEATTSKEFMLTPNLPRFVRTGDQTTIAATVMNLTEKAVSGEVIFTLFDPATDKVITTRKQKFNTEAGKNQAVSFDFTASDKYDLLGCRIVAKGSGFSDGEQHLLPVLSNKEMITETVALPIKGNETREFALEGLFNNNSKTAVNRRLTLEFSGNPAWYAVQALPALTVPTNDNAISWAVAYYANSLSAYIVQTQPKIKSAFDAWTAQGGNKESFLSNLEKNQELKNILLEESPWLMEATSEAERMKRIATLFDLNNVRVNNLTALNKLMDLQQTNGAWVWFKGMPGSRYVTTFVLETLIRLNNLTGELSDDANKMKSTAFEFLHKGALKAYRAIREAEQKGHKPGGLSGSALDYLYLIAISGETVPESSREAYNYFLGQLSKSITNLSLKDKAHAALILSKAGKVEATNDFIISLKEHAVTTDENGMHFAFNESPYSWKGQRIAAHVAVMETLDEVTKDTPSVESMKLWLLKQKQAQQWESPVATANAIYALLYRGSNLLDNRGEVQISLGGKTFNTLSGSNIPGATYLKEVITEKSARSKIRKVTVKKQDEGMAWGAIYAQYQEEIGKVSQHGGGLNVEKKLYVERVSGSSTTLVPITDETVLAVGDKVVSRLTIRLDRAMDFVQLKEQRSACLEPLRSNSGYVWQNNIGYYLSVKDASTNFFFNSLNKGVYVLESSYRVSRTGTYEGGLAVIQSAYAPEYASHSSSSKITVK
ncbi:alpha-2-macroglobulin [Bacteroides sp. OttesenSCG-928-M17]|nr:alpha-2-macroglobulin [Bacteroides sp. OttesenSCG-928-M17]